MNKVFAVLSAFLLLTACGDDDVDSTPPPRTNPMDASLWEIGPIIGRTNYSVGLPLHPTPETNGFSFAIGPIQQPHYVTYIHGSLRGKTLVHISYRIEGSETAIIHGANCATSSPSSINLYFQEENDNWVTDGKRWWATFAKKRLVLGSHVVEARLDGPWTSVEDMNATTHPTIFNQAKNNAYRVGFTFSNCTGQGHGVTATEPVKFIVTDFKVL
jgi:hypothetical protein